MALPITMYGSHTCEDTAIARDHLHALDILFIEHDKEDDPNVQALLEKYNHGSPRTPTIVFGKGETVLVEPALDQLDDALRGAGYVFAATPSTQFNPPFSDRVLPDLKLPSTRGGEFELGRLRNLNRSVLFFAHHHACRVCQGFARQLAARRKEYEESGARLVLVLQDDVEHAREWSAEFASNVETLADPGGVVKNRLQDHMSSALETFDGGTFLLVLDKFTAPRAGSAAPDAGGLMLPKEAAEWLHLLEYECDE